MSTRTFKIGNAEVFQDKPSEETRRAIQIMHKTQEDNLYATSEPNLEEFMESLSDKLSKLDESVLNAFVNVLTRKVKTKKQNKDAKN